MKKHKRLLVAIAIVLLLCAALRFIPVKSGYSPCIDGKNYHIIGGGAAEFEQAIKAGESYEPAINEGACPVYKPHRLFVL